MNVTWLGVFLICVISWGSGTFARTVIYKNTSIEFDSPTGYRNNQFWYVVFAVTNFLSIVGAVISGAMLLFEIIS